MLKLTTLDRLAALVLARKDSLRTLVSYVIVHIIKRHQFAAVEQTLDHTEGADLISVLLQVFANDASTEWIIETLDGRVLTVS